MAAGAYSRASSPDPAFANEYENITQVRNLRMAQDQGQRQVRGGKERNGGDCWMVVRLPSEYEIEKIVFSAPGCADKFSSRCLNPTSYRWKTLHKIQCPPGKGPRAEYTERGTPVYGWLD